MEERAFRRFEGKPTAASIDRGVRARTRSGFPADISRASLFIEIDGQTDRFVRNSIDTFLFSFVEKPNVDINEQAQSLIEKFPDWQLREAEAIDQHYFSSQQAEVLRGLTVEHVDVYTQERLAEEGQKFNNMPEHAKPSEASLQKWHVIRNIAHRAYEISRSSEEKEYEDMACEAYIKEVCGQKDNLLDLFFEQSWVDERAAEAVDGLVGWQEEIFRSFSSVVGDDYDLCWEAKVISGITVEKVTFIAEIKYKMAKLAFDAALATDAELIDADITVEYWERVIEVMRKAVEIERRLV